VESTLNPESHSGDEAMESPAVVTETPVTATAPPAEPELPPPAADPLFSTTPQEPPADAPPSVPSPDDETGTLPLLQAQSQAVIDRLTRFEAQLAEHLSDTASCSRAAFDYLYDEMQSYKKNFLREAQRPLLLDLMMLYDSIDQLRRSYKHASSVDPATLFQNLDALQVEAEEILGRVGIERMSATPERLDVNLQRAVKTVPTDNPEEHMLVVEQIKAGFISGEQTLRKEQVAVKKYAPRATSDGAAGAGEPPRS
jgi:molecular chaperone GrpE (heat shock protein)